MGRRAICPKCAQVHLGHLGQHSIKRNDFTSLVVEVKGKYLLARKTLIALSNASILPWRTQQRRSKRSPFLRYKAKEFRQRHFDSCCFCRKVGNNGSHFAAFRLAIITDATNVQADFHFWLCSHRCNSLRTFGDEVQLVISDLFEHADSRPFNVVLSAHYRPENAIFTFSNNAPLIRTEQHFRTNLEQGTESHQSHGG